MTRALWPLITTFINASESMFDNVKSPAILLFDKCKWCGTWGQSFDFNAILNNGIFELHSFYWSLDNWSLRLWTKSSKHWPNIISVANFNSGMTVVTLSWYIDRIYTVTVSEYILKVFVFWINLKKTSFTKSILKKWVWKKPEKRRLRFIINIDLVIMIHHRCDLLMIWMNRYMGVPH